MNTQLNRSKEVSYEFRFTYVIAIFLITALGVFVFHKYKRGKMIVDLRWILKKLENRFVNTSGMKK